MMEVKLYLHAPEAIVKLAEIAEIEDAAYRRREAEAMRNGRIPASVAPKLADIDEPIHEPDAEEVEEPAAKKRGRPPKAAKPEPEPEVAPKAKKPAEPAPAPAPAKPKGPPPSPDEVDSDALPFDGDVSKATEAYHGKFGLVPLKTLLKYRHHVNRGSEIKPEKTAAYLRDVETALRGGVPWSIEDAIEPTDD